MADIDNEPEVIDMLGAVLPLPYRLSAVITLCVWLWGVNLYGLSRVSIDAPSLVKYSSRADHPPHLSTLRFATVLTTPLASSLLLFWLTSREGLTGFSHTLANLTLIWTLALFLLPTKYAWPSHLFPSDGRWRILTTLRRVLIGGLARAEDGKFGDVLLADALTSLARPLSEIYITFCAMITGVPTWECTASAAIPFFLAAPFAMRFRQCIIDHQYANAAKYATAFPTIIFSTMMKSDKGYLIMGLPISNLWLLAALTNALYSFYWDVSCDWDLTLFTPYSTSREYPFGLRRVRYYRDEYYYAMIGVDLLLRFAWAFKLSPHLEHYYDIEGGIFILEILEAGRRFLWIFFRVETEWVRSKHGLNGGNEDVLLGDVGVKLDED